MQRTYACKCTPKLQLHQEQKCCTGTVTSFPEFHALWQFTDGSHVTVTVSGTSKTTRWFSICPNLRFGPTVLPSRYWPQYHWKQLISYSFKHVRATDCSSAAEDHCNSKPLSQRWSLCESFRFAFLALKVAYQAFTWKIRSARPKSIPFFTACSIIQRECLFHPKNLCSTNFSSTAKDHCNPNPCLNGGRCVNQGSTYLCICQFGFGGAVCNKSRGSAFFSEFCKSHNFR